MQRIKWAASAFVLLAFLAGALEAGDDDTFLYIIKDMTVFYDGNTGEPLAENRHSYHVCLVRDPRRGVIGNGRR